MCLVLGDVAVHRGGFDIALTSQLLEVQETDASAVSQRAERMLRHVWMAPTAFDTSVQGSVFENVADRIARHSRAKPRSEQEHAANVFAFAQPSRQGALFVESDVRVRFERAIRVERALESFDIDAAISNVFEFETANFGGARTMCVSQEND